MSPAPSTTHQRVVFNLGLILSNFFRGRHCRVLAVPVDVLLPRADEVDGKVETVVQPDLLVVCDLAKISEHFILLLNWYKKPPC